MGRGFAMDREGRELLVGEREDWWARGRIGGREGGLVSEGRVVCEREDQWARGKTSGREGRPVGKREDQWVTGVGKDENRRGVDVPYCWALLLFPKWIIWASYSLGTPLKGVYAKC